MEKIYSWRGMVLLGAVASFLAGLAANYAPFPREIEALMPVLRSNFWLGIHVLTEVTSYAFFAAAWVIGNLALGLLPLRTLPNGGAAAAVQLDCRAGSDGRRGRRRLTGGHCS